ncbi:hypothetical protein D3C74_453750 [compost metagenome]
MSMYFKSEIVMMTDKLTSRSPINVSHEMPKTAKIHTNSKPVAISPSGYISDIRVPQCLHLPRAQM